MQLIGSIQSEGEAFPKLQAPAKVKGIRMNTKNPYIAPISGKSTSETAHSYVNFEAIDSVEVMRLAVKALKVVTKEPISYAKAEIVLDYAKQLLDSMLITDSVNTIAEIEKFLS